LEMQKPSNSRLLAHVTRQTWKPLSERKDFHAPDWVSTVSNV